MEDNSTTIRSGIIQSAKADDEELKTNAFELFNQGFNNLKIAKELQVTYEMIVALRISYEKAHLSCN